MYEEGFTLHINLKLKEPIEDLEIFTEELLHQVAQLPIFDIADEVEIECSDTVD